MSVRADRRQQIARAFSTACDYDRHAHVQREVARHLAARIVQLKLPASPRILEIGCGTGYLTEALLESGIGGDWLVTDLSLQMLERCRSRIGEREGVRYAILDGQRAHPEFAQQFDLVCSSLAVQWFESLQDSLGQMLSWLAPGGHCVFTTLGATTFSEWRAAHEREKLAAGTPELPSAAQLALILPQAQASPLVVEYYRQAHGTGAAFLKSLKAIGAGTPARQHTPLSPAQLKRVMCQFESAGAAATYEILTCHYGRSDSR